MAVASVFLRQQCYMLCTSSFVYAVMFSHNGQAYAMQMGHMLKVIHHQQHHGQGMMFTIALLMVWLLTSYIINKHSHWLFTKDNPYDDTQTHEVSALI